MTILEIESEKVWDEYGRRCGVKILTVVGARPQFIKAGAVSRAIRERNSAQTSRGTLKEILLHTGQHYDENMSEIFFSELSLPMPDYNLGVNGGTHGEQTGKMIIKIEEVLLKEMPQLVVVYGDTNSTLAGALAAAKLHIPIAHVEAGLRSFNRMMPEEMNRIITDHISDYLFCPTRTAVSNLTREGIEKGVYDVGDVMYDSLLYYSNAAAGKPEYTLWAVSGRLQIYAECPVRPIELAAQSYYLATVHRAENTIDKKRLSKILSALSRLELPVILPLHPRTKKALEDADINFKSGSIVLAHPLSYLDMLVLEKNARAVLTDSGGMQKESYFLGVPCITLRDESEWLETTHNGWNKVVGADADRIITSAEDSKRGKKPRGKKENDSFGNGNAGKKIVDILSNVLAQNHD